METVALPPSRGLPLKDLLTDREGCASASRGGANMPRVMNKIKAVTVKAMIALSLHCLDVNRASNISPPFRFPGGKAMQNIIPLYRDIYMLRIRPAIHAK
jgi:hypothetical protein